MRKARFLIALLLGSNLAGCNVGNLPTSGSLPAAYPTKPMVDDLGRLVQPSAVSQSELEANLNNPVTLQFPVRVGVLYFGFTPSLKPEDEQAVAQTITDELKASGLATSVVFIPPSLTSREDSIENIRKLASRFQTDVLVFVDGDTAIALADNQDRGFFGSFSNRANYEARSTITALGMSVLTGRYLAPLQAIGHAGPQALSPDDPSYAGGVYELKREAETEALTELKNQLLQVLRAVPGAPANQEG